MKSGYKIRWTDAALEELQQTLNYLEENFSENEIQKLARKIETTTELISQNPLIFPKSDVKNVHRTIVLKFNTLYYRISVTKFRFYHFSQIVKVKRKEKSNSILL